MNPNLKQMLRHRRQVEGRRPREPYYPPETPSEFPPTFAFHRNTEVGQRQWRDLPPAYEYNALNELPTAHQGMAQSLDASNPPDSDFYAEGNKIRPWAHTRAPAYLAIPEIESVSLDEFPWYGTKVAFGHLLPQQVGGQHSIDVSPLIPEAEFTTFGALTTLAPGEELAEDGYLYA